MPRVARTCQGTGPLAIAWLTAPFMPPAPGSGLGLPGLLTRHETWNIVSHEVAYSKDREPASSYMARSPRMLDAFRFWGRNKNEGLK